MANVTARCELMQNAFPAGPLSLQGKFYVVEDFNGEHMIFSIDERGSLCLVAKGAEGHNELINLSTLLAINDTSKVTALAVTQSRQSLVYLAFSVSQPDVFDQLHVMKPMQAERRAWLDATALKAGLYIGQQSEITISDILMGNGNDWVNAEYPELYLTVKLAGKSTQDLWAITVSNSTSSWKREPFEMTCNPERIVSKCVGNLGNRKAGFQAYYRGLFVLYEQAVSSEPLQLRFYGIDFTLANPTLQSFALPVPANAKLLASFDNPEGFTDLLICADTLLWRSAVDCFTKSQKPYEAPAPYRSANGETIPGPLLPNLGLKQISLAQAGDKFSLWVLDQSSLLSYQDFQMFPKPLPAGQKVPQPPPQALSPPIPLLDQSSHGGRFVCIQNPRFGQKLFVMSDDNRSLNMLQQSVETRIWQSPIDIMIPDSDEVREFLSHTISVQVEDQSKSSLRNVELLLCCSISAEMLVNGVFTRGSLNGMKVKTDEQGLLTVIIPADGMVAPVLTIKDVPGSDELLHGRSVDVDPMQKLWDQMTQVNTIDDLRSLKLADGSPFVNADMSEKDLRKALKAIQDLCKARQNIASGGGKTQTATTSADRVWGAWFRLGVEEAYDWVVEKVDKAYKFVIKIAGQVWEFFVENFPQIAAAMQKILGFISKGWEWVKKKFEEIFPWKDILAIKHALVNITTAGIIMGSDVFADLEEKADERFIGLRAKVRELKNKSLPKELTDVRISKDPPSPQGPDSENMAGIINSPQMQYGAYHLRHSAGKQSESGLIGPRAEGESSFDRLVKRLSGILDSLVALAVRFGVNILDLFSNKDFGLDVLIAKIGLELAEDALGVVQKVVVALLGSLSDLLLELADAMNADIKIPVIGPLYSKLTQGSRFTVLDMVCLLLAIPATLAYKAAIGPLPKEDKGYQRLVRPDALKGALDLRMGRIRSGEALGKPMDTSVPSQMVSFRETSQHPNGHKPTLSGLESRPPRQTTKTDESAALQMNMMNFSHRQGSQTQSSHSDISGAAVDQAVQSQTRGWWVEVGKPGSKILQILLPVGAAIYTAGYKLPKAMLAGDTQSTGSSGSSSQGAKQPRKSWWKLVLKLVFWVGKGLIICLPKMKDMSKDLGTLAKLALKDDVFGWKFIIWAIPGFLPVGAHLINEYVGYCAEAVAGITQTIALVAMHIDVYAISKASYPWYKCPEEYVNALAKVAVAQAVITQGKEPYSLGFAFGLTGVGKMWSYIRLQVELVMPNENDEDRGTAIDDTV